MTRYKTITYWKSGNTTMLRISGETMGMFIRDMMNNPGVDCVKAEAEHMPGMCHIFDRCGRITYQKFTDFYYMAE